ncbi:MAG: GNAT family N-acetyltransferase [Clostridia bacterium]|nr:GNAT family N-acetyltransferase [Clostridia bacterium]
MIKLSKLVRSDVPKMMAWGKHYDPRFFHYNFDLSTENGFELWYRSKRKIFLRRIYKVENEENKMVGFITIKNINWATRVAEMGIVFDPNELSKGYGTEGMKVIFKEFFEVMKMNRLYLRVAAFNQRAYRSYIKAGFRVYKKQNDPFENQQMNQVINQQFDGFHMEGDVLYTDYIYMDVDKERYFKGNL